MRKLLFLMVVVSLVAVPAVAQFQQLVEFRVKSGQELAFENYVKKIKEGADKIGSPTRWSTFLVAVGKDGPTYRVGLLFEKWSERDQWQPPLDILVKAFGEQEGQKIYTSGTSAIASSSSRIWEVIEDGTANPQTVSSELSPFYEVTIRYVKPEMVAEYRGLLRRFKSAYEASDKNPSVTRWALSFGTGNGTTFRRTQPFDKWADRDGWSARAVIAEQFGDDAPLLIERLRSAVWKTEHFVSAYRPDLSRDTAASPSND